MSEAGRERPVELESALGYRFHDGGLLERALTHSSLGSTPEMPDNETLEFLGDAVLGLAVSELLMQAHPELDEGALSRFRAALVNAQSLARLARELGVGSFIRLGKGEEKTGGRNKESILSDCYEALVGAAFLDGGYEAARELLARHFHSLLQDETGWIVDDKTRLQERTQRDHKTTPCYRVTAATGPDHAKVYEVEVLLEGRVLARGRGRSRKDAEQDAAGKALAMLPAKEDA